MDNKDKTIESKTEKYVSMSSALSKSSQSLQEQMEVYHNTWRIQSSPLYSRESGK